MPCSVPPRPNERPVPGATPAACWRLDPCRRDTALCVRATIPRSTLHLAARLDPRHLDVCLCRIAGCQWGRLAMESGIHGWDEDNHHPGIVRHFWLPLDASKRVQCQCKDTELVITEPDGHTWTTPRDGPCRGCELRGLTGRACPLHATTPTREVSA